MKPSGAAIAGAVFFLVLFATSVAGVALFVANGLFLPSIPCVVMAAILGYAIVKSDWPVVWKPLLSGDK